MRLLVTRPEPDAHRTAATLRSRGCEVIITSLTHIETLVPALGRGPWQALALTSANAARAIERQPRRAELLGLPVFVVGRHTAAAARRAGFAEIHSAEGDVADLVRIIATHLRGRSLLYLAGEDRARDLALALGPHGIAVETVVVYRAVKTARLVPEAVAALRSGGIDGVLHYSRRNSEIYLECAQAAGLVVQALAPTHYCLSQRVAAPLVSAGARDVRIAQQPRQGALFDLIAACQDATSNHRSS